MSTVYERINKIAQENKQAPYKDVATISKPQNGQVVPIIAPEGLSSEQVLQNQPILQENVSNIQQEQIAQSKIPAISAKAEVGKPVISPETQKLIEQQKKQNNNLNWFDSGMKTISEVGTYLGNLISLKSPIAQMGAINKNAPSWLGMPSQESFDTASRATQLTSSGLINGITGGIIKSDRVTPQGVFEKIVQEGSNLYGMVTGLGAISATTEAAGLSSLTSNIGNTLKKIGGIESLITKYPAVGKVASSLFKEAINFNIYGQLNPDNQDRLGSLISNTALTPLFAAQKYLPGSYSIPASFGLGYGLTKLGGGSTEDALISGGMFAVMEGLNKTSDIKGKKVITTEQANNILNSESIDILNRYSNLKISEVSGKEEIRKSYLDAIRKNAPDFGGNEQIASSINRAYEQLSGKKQSYTIDANSYTPKTSKETSVLIKEGGYEKVANEVINNKAKFEEAIKSGKVTPEYKKQTILQNSINQYQENNRSLVLERNTNNSQLQVFTFSPKEGQYQYSIKYQNPNTNIVTDYTGNFKTKEQAVQAGKEKTIEILKNEFQKGNKDAKSSIALTLLDKNPLDAEINQGKIPTTLKTLDNTQKLFGLIDEARKSEAIQTWKKDYQTKYNDLINKFKEKINSLISEDLFHGTNVLLEGNKLSFGKGDLKKGGQSGGLFLTDTKSIAEVFGKNIYKFDSKIKNEVLDLTTEKGIEKIKNYIGKKYKTFDGEKIEFTKQDFEAMFPNGKTDFASVSQYPEFIEKVVKDSGKKGIAFNEYAGGKEGKTYQFLSDNIPIKQSISDTISSTKKLSNQLSKIENDFVNKFQVKEEKTKVLYHGTAETNLKNLEVGNEGNLGKGIYLTDNKDSAQYYGNLASESKVLKAGNYTGEEMPKGNVLEVFLKPDIKIKELDYLPTKEEVDNIKKEGFDGITYPDEIIEATEGVKNIPIGSKATLIFDKKSVGIKAESKPKSVFKTNQKKEAETKKTPAITQEKQPLKPVDKKLYSRVSERMAEEYPGIDLIERNKIKIDKEIESGLRLLEKDKNKAYRTALGIEGKSEYKKTAVNIAMTKQALKEGNVKLVNELIKNRSLRQTDFGQSIVLEKATVSNNSPQQYIKEVLAERFNKLGDKYLGTLDKKLGKSPSKVAKEKINSEVKKIKEKIKKDFNFKLEEAQNWLDSLACK